MPGLRPALFWTGLYAGTMLLVLWGLWRARERIIVEQGSPEMVAAWQAWERETREPQPGQPVARRPVKSDEPPSVILMRDHFGAIVGVTLLIGSFLFAFLAFLALGLSQQRMTASREDRPNTPGGRASSP